MFIFSTDLLQYLSKKTIQKSTFNFVLKNLIFKKKIKNKDIDFLIYHRIIVINLLFDNKLFKDLVKLNLKIIVVGDRLNISKFKNLGYISKKVDILQQDQNTLSSRGKYL